MARERKFEMVDRKPEFDLAWEIIRQLVAPAVDANPSLDLCMVRQYAEMMFTWKYPQDIAAKDPGHCGEEAVPTTRSY